MTATSLDQVTILGAGVLGGQIAWQSAFSGKTVVVYDLHQAALDQCKTAQQTYAHIYQQDLNATEQMLLDTRARISFTDDLAVSVAKADLVIEAVPEIPQVKVEVYEELANYLPPHTLLVTNSSTLLPGMFAQVSGRPENYCALHFANLIWALNIAEIMAHSETSHDTLEAITRFAIEIGMVPIPIQKEQNGYVLNTMMVALANAAQTLVTNGVATPEYIDRTYMIMNRGCAMGPCGLMDVVGMNTLYNIFSHWSEENNDDQMRKNAAYLKQYFIDEGLLGLAKGEGYYKYPDPWYQATDFLDVPDISRAREISLMATL